MKKIIQLCWVSRPQTFTPRIFVILTLVLLHQQQALAQFSDDFSDQDFTNLPIWTGNDSHFIVDLNRLRLQAPEAGISFMSTTSQVLQDASWEFTVVMDFNPSSSNHTRIYVTSDQMNLAGPLNGYFVMVGDNNDEVSLYKQTGTSYSKLIDGRDGVLNTPSVTIKIRVAQNNGIWQLFVDNGATGNYEMEGAIADESATPVNYFGLLCNYTATRKDKFYFDDFIITGTTLKDENPPTLEKVEVISSTQLKLVFSEPLDEIIASQLENYEVDHEIGNPESAVIELDNLTVGLFFVKSFPENRPSILTISNITDLNGNKMQTTSRSFTFHVPVQAIYKDLIITEIFPDPSPLVGLPESEFIEIHNRSTKAFNLKEWTLTDQTSTAEFPDFVLLPNEYLILTAKPSLFHFPNVITLENFPSLNNVADKLTLKDAANVTVDSVSYSDDWYRDEDKKKGGWTLELIDPQNLCSENENWIASENSKGGSPGEQNSVLANKPDLTGPQLRSVTPITSTLIQLKFDEKLERRIPLTTYFEISPSIAVTNASFSDPSLTEIQLSLGVEMQPATLYSVAISNIHDCTGNLILQDFTKAEFGLPQRADSLDILVNEILFNPLPTGVDFVEIVNNSTKFINLKNWSVANIENEVIKNISLITQNNLLFKPGDYLVLTENVDILKGEYSLSQEKNFLRVNKLPAFSDDEGSVALIDSNGYVIDYLVYSKDMHSVFVKDEEGVSLERISFSQSTTSDQNWKSASAHAGFATPGYLNSNSTHDLPVLPQPLKVEPEIFNPMGGQPDFTQIHYQFDQGGYVANVKIFDPQGHLIKQLANNDVLGTTGFYRWDGDREDGSKVRVGYYMVWFEIFNEHGVTRKYQQRVAVATQF
jgi:hypothetical protein